MSIHSKISVPRDQAPFLAVLVLITVAGLGYVFLTPPFEAPDEPAHFARAYGIAEGQWILNDHPRDLVEFARDAMKRHPDFSAFMTGLLETYDDRVPNQAFNTALYSPFAYAFHALAIRTAIVLDKKPGRFLRMLFLCRLTSLALFVGALFWASALCPSLKWPLVWVALTPMLLAQAASVNLDGIVFSASAILLLASFGGSGHRHLMSVMIAGFFLGLAKPPYMVLMVVPAATLWLGNTEKKGVAAFWLATGFALAFLATVLWANVLRNHGLIEQHIHWLSAGGTVDIRPDRQLREILAVPWRFLDVVLNTFTENGGSLFRQFIGVLSWLDTPIPDWIGLWWAVFLGLAVFVSEPVFDGNARNLRLWGGLTSVAAAGASLGLVLATAYLMWTPVGSDTIAMLQGRYFHSVALALVIGLATMKPVSWNLSDRSSGLRWGLVSAGLVMQAVALFTLGAKFWGNQIP